MFRLSKEHVGFIESGVSIVVASRDVQNRPVQGRAGGCRAAPDGSEITLFLSRAKYPFLLDALRRGGAVAASFNEPSTNRSLQIKGAAAELTPLLTGDAARISAYLDLFAADVERIHVSGDLPRAVLAGAVTDLEAVRFTPQAAFVQTPGPQAGKKLVA
jgi:hypothetical protein